MASSSAPPSPAATVPSKKKQRTWDESYEALKAYKDANGDCNCPSDYKEDPGLATFVRRQRLNKDKLTEEQRSKLEKLGFSFENPGKARLEKQWNENFERLKKYNETNGDCDNIPKKYVTDSNAKLGSWAHDQRQSFRKGTLPENRKKLLESIGFTLETKQLTQRNTTKNDEKWQQQYQKLVEYKKKHNNANVPQRYSEEPSLGIWCDTQRQQYARDLLREDRKNLLKDIGFKFHGQRNSMLRRKSSPSRDGSQPGAFANDDTNVQQLTPKETVAPPPAPTLTLAPAPDPANGKDPGGAVTRLVRQVAELGDEALKAFEEMTEKFLIEHKRKPNSDVLADGESSTKRVKTDYSEDSVI